MENTDQEQVEALKRWFNQYGLPILAGIVVAGLIFGGFRFYSSSVEQKRQVASESYQNLVVALEEDRQDAAALRRQIAELVAEHSGTAYAGLASMHLASLEVEQGDYRAALRALETASNSLKQDSMQDVIKLRQARLLYQLERDADALALLASASASTQSALKFELKGDIYAEQNQFGQAREAYEQALTAAQLIEGRMGIINLKLNNLPADL